MKTLLVALLSTIAGAPAEDELDSVMTSVLRLEPKGGGFEAKLTDVLSSARVDAITVRADWWTGPSDDRAGDPARARSSGHRLQLLVERTWVDLPAISRNLRLEGEAAPPRDAVKGLKARWLWKVRAVEGEMPARVSLVIRYRVPWGKSLAMPDLRFSWFVPSGRERPGPGREISLHDRAPVLRVAPGEEISGEVELHNTGFGDVNKADWRVMLRPWATRSKGGARLHVGEVRLLREGGKLGRRPNLRIPKGTKPGEYALVFLVDVQGRVKELDERNNDLHFPLLVRAAD